MTGRFLTVVLAIILAGVASTAFAAEQSEQFAARLVTLDDPPLLDGDAGWDAATAVRLRWDFTHARTAPQPAVARIAVARGNLFVRFFVPQREPVVATQRVNDAGDGSDDEVSIYLWPTGVNGFRYQFSATPNGTHYQYSTENNVYSPTWASYGRVGAGGYEVVMRIPLSALRSDGRGEWNVQFTRTIRASDETDVWAHAPNQADVTSAQYAGVVGGFQSAANVARTKPRMGVYGLGSLGSPPAGGDTSRTGADLAVPITPTSSFVATIHPDFSNVEQDQQTISPTTFARQFNEVRPFFSQSAANILSGTCYACPGFLELYTPSIPTPRYGYALEGTQGEFRFGAFDAVGSGRQDSAESVSYTTPSRKFSLRGTRVAADLPGIHDDTSIATATYDTLAHVAAYVEYGYDRGTFVADGAQGQRYDAGIQYYTKDVQDVFSMRKIGAYYNPYDGLIAQTDLAGYSLHLDHTLRFGSTAPWQSLRFTTFVDRYMGRVGGIDLSDQYVTFLGTTRTKFAFEAQVGSQYDKAPGDAILRPATQMTEGVFYQAGTALQSQVLYNVGAFGDGRLVFVQADGGFKVFRAATFSFNADVTNWHGDGKRNVQWLERMALTFDLGPRSSLTLGARKIVGTAPQFTTPQPFLNLTNISAGFSKRWPHDELYVVYGDASRLTTYPAAILKWIHYFGAEKGA